MGFYKLLGAVMTFVLAVILVLTLIGLLRISFDFALGK